jgi:hypothetical protein
MLFESVFAGIWRAFYSADAYRNVAVGRTLHCVLLLGVVVSVIALATAANMAVEMRAVGAELAESFAGAPDIHIEDGEARLDPPGRFVGTLDGEPLLVLDPEMSADEALSGDAGFFLTRTHLLVRQKGRTNDRSLSLADVDDRVITESDLRRWTGMLFRWLPWVLLPFLALFSWIWRSALSAALAIAGIPLAGALGARLDYASSFRIATLAIVPTLVIGLGATLADAQALWPRWAGALCTLGYFVFGVRANRESAAPPPSGVTLPPPLGG